MNAPLRAPVADLILGAIAKATSKRPANAADVLALIGGEEAAYWAAVEQLVRDRRIASAHFFRPAVDAAPWVAIWPTGVLLPSVPMSGKTLSGLFAPQRRDALRDAYAPRSTAIDPPKTVTAKPKEPAMPAQAPKKTRDAARNNRDTIATLVQGLTADKGLLVRTIAEKIGLTVNGANYLIDSMMGGTRVARTRLPGDRCDRIYDPSAEQVEHVKATPPTDAEIATLEVDPVPAAPPEQPAYRHDDIQVREFVAGDLPSALPSMDIRFSLWDDGSLSVYDGDELTLLPSDAVKRLALLLGVPRDAVPAPVPTLAILSGPAVAAASQPR